MKKKAVLTLLTFVTTLTMTACTLQFRPVSDEINSSTTIHVDIDSVVDLIDQADFLDQDDLETLTEGLNEFAESVTEEREDLEGFEKATLVRVVDGDTIVVEIDGQEAKVRLIGIDTPESVASKEYLDRTGKENTQAGKDASEHTKELLSQRTEVYLQKDTSDTDRYGRLLRYVWLEVPKDDHDLTEISTKMLNGILLKDGYAEVATYKPDTAHQTDFEAIEEMTDMER